MASNTPSGRSSDSDNHDRISDEDLQNLAELFAIVNQQGEEGWSRLLDNDRTDVEPLPEERLRDIARMAIQQGAKEEHRRQLRERARAVLDRLSPASADPSSSAARIQEHEELVNDLLRHLPLPSETPVDITQRPETNGRT